MKFDVNIKLLASKPKEHFAGGFTRIIRSINTTIPTSTVKGWWHQTNNWIYKTGDVFYQWMDEFVLMSEIRDERPRENESIGLYADTPANPPGQFNIRCKNLYRRVSRTYEMFLLKSDLLLFGISPPLGNDPVLEIVNPGALGLQADTQSKMRYRRLHAMAVVGGYFRYFFRQWFSGVLFPAKSYFSKTQPWTRNEFTICPINLLWRRDGWGYS